MKQLLKKFPKIYQSSCKNLSRKTTPLIYKLFSYWVSLKVFFLRIGITLWKKRKLLQFSYSVHIIHPLKEGSKSFLCLTKLSPTVICCIYTIVIGTYYYSWIRKLSKIHVYVSLLHATNWNIVLAFHQHRCKYLSSFKCVLLYSFWEPYFPTLTS